MKINLNGQRGQTTESNFVRGAAPSTNKSCNLPKGVLASRQYSQCCSKCRHRALICLEVTLGGSLSDERSSNLRVFSQKHFTSCTFPPAVEFISCICLTAARYTRSVLKEGRRACGYDLSESYVSGITPHWVGMWIMPLCECVSVLYPRVSWPASVSCRRCHLVWETAGVNS